MTLLVLDVASYQGSLPTSLVAAAGFGGVNLKISHGLTRKSVHPDVAGWVDRSRAAKLEISTFHYFTADAPGAAQADFAHDRMEELGLASTAAHQLDVECDPAPKFAEVVAYVARMTDLLGRPIALYTGDWWWKPKGWTLAGSAPYLWAAPNDGYLGDYPGDASTHWRAGYGGWANLAIMQYAVKPLPGSTIKVSMSAVRDPAVWRTLTGGGAMVWTNVPASASLLAEFNQVGPRRDMSKDGTIGNDDHAQTVSDHNPDETGNTGGVEDADSINEVHARDVTSKGPWRAGFSMERFVQIILARCRSGAERRLRYIIFNRRIWTDGDGWAQHSYSGPSPHTEHAHFSFRYGSGSGTANPENITAPWGILAAVEGEEDVALEQSDIDAIAARVWSYGVNGVSAGGRITQADQRVNHIMVNQLPAVASGVSAVLANVQADDGDHGALMSRLDQVETETAQAAADAVRATFGGPDASAQDIADALVAALGADKAAEVGAALSQ